MKEHLVIIDADTGDEMPDNYPDRGKPPFHLIIRDSCGFIMGGMVVSADNPVRLFDTGDCLLKLELVPKDVPLPVTE